MSLFLDLAGVSGTAFFNLLDIARGDGGLGLTDVVGDATVFKITYNEAPGQGPTADRLNTLVNTDFGTPIVITALNGGNDPHTGQDETGNGHTYVDSTGSSPVIRVAYDVSQACGAGIFTFDVNGNKITTPNPVILYHELSHAFHDAINQNPFPQNACPGNTTDEPAAEIDENVLRTALGLCQRDVCNHDGGKGAGSDCGGSAGNPDSGPPAGGCPAGNKGCFIVSAATGSPESEEINQLRRLRDRVSVVSGLGAQLIDLVYGEYFQFSPAVAEQLAGDVMARQAVLAVVVRPLLAWYALAGALGPGFENRSTEEAARAVVDACPTLFGRSAVANALAALRSDGELSPGAARALGQFAPGIREVAGMRFVAWAILDPLARLWSAAARDSDMVHEVAQWLAAAPLEATVPPTDPVALDREIAALARLLAFRPEVKLDLGPRLAAAWPAASGVLARHGFLASRPKQGDPS
jgi:hypothetical protein